MPDPIKQIPDNLQNFDFYEFNRRNKSEKIAIFHNGADQLNPENNKQNGIYSVFRQNPSGQYESITDQNEAKRYLDDVIAHKTSLPSKTGSKSQNPSEQRSNSKLDKASRNTSCDESWSGCGANKNDTSPKSKNINQGLPPDSQTPQDQSNETIKPQAQNLDSSQKKSQEVELKKQENPVSKIANQDDSIIEHPFPELPSKQDGGYKVKDDSSSAIKASLKEGGIDLDETMTRLSLAKDIISQLSMADQMKILSNPMKIEDNLAQVLKETDQETEQSKALSVIDKIYLNDPVKAAAISLFIANGSKDNRDKNDLESMAASLYDSATSKVTTSRELSQYKSNIKAGERYYEETIKIPEAKRSQAQIEFLKMYQAYKNLPEHYQQTQVSMDFIQDAINFYTMPELTDGTF